MLELRPSCEHCDKDLPPDCAEAMMCTFECTFCQACVDNVLNNVCPNCGGGFVYRPIRPKQNWRNGNYLGEHPASDTRIFKPVSVAQHKQFCKKIQDIAPEHR